MASVNKVILVGNIGKDPETRKLPDGTNAVSFVLATNTSWKDKKTGEKKEETEWHKCTAYAQIAEIVGQYVKKGSMLYVEGRLKTRKYQDQSGQDRYITEIVADKVTMLNKRETSSDTQQTQSGDYARRKDPPRQQDFRSPQNIADFDDDVPF